LGFYLKNRVWIKLAIPTFLIILTLPFGNLMDTYLGFPLRMVAADIIQSLLSSLGYDSINRETIISMENQATQINMNCSGMKGLWASIIFFLTLSWVYRLHINLKWLIVLLLNCFIVLLFNLIRITTLVFTELIFDQSELANLIHTPIGLIGFTFSCLITWSLIYYWLLQKKPNSRNTKIFERFRITTPEWIKLRNEGLALNLIAICLLLILYFKPNANFTDQPQPREIALQWPKNLHLEPINLTENEHQFFTLDNCTPIKRKFKYRSLEGTLLLVFNASFRGHHHPEVCMQGAGLKVDQTSTLLVDLNFPVRMISFHEKMQTATYWFQAPNLHSEDFSNRIWLELLGEKKEWVMISLLFNQKIQVQNTDYHELLMLISNQINNNF
jgi:exosortase O